MRDEDRRRIRHRGVSRTRPTFRSCRPGASRCCSARARSTSRTPPTSGCRSPSSTAAAAHYVTLAKALLEHCAVTRPALHSAGDRSARGVRAPSRRPARSAIAALDRINFTISNIRLAIALIGAVAALDGVRARRRSRRRGRSPRGVASACSRSSMPSGCSASSAPGRPSASTCAASSRLDDRWAGTGRDGATFLEGHPYARDLDLFGPASLFELLNTTRTEIGELTLADWLRGPAPLGRSARAPGGDRRAAADARLQGGRRGAGVGVAGRPHRTARGLGRLAGRCASRRRCGWRWRRAR